MKYAKIDVKTSNVINKLHEKLESKWINYYLSTRNEYKTSKASNSQNGMKRTMDALQYNSNNVWLYISHEMRWRPLMQPCVNRSHHGYDINVCCSVLFCTVAHTTTIHSVLRVIFFPLSRKRFTIHTIICTTRGQPFWIGFNVKNFWNIHIERNEIQKQNIACIADISSAHFDGYRFWYPRHQLSGFYFIGVTLTFYMSSTCQITIKKKIWLFMWTTEITK